MARAAPRPKGWGDALDGFERQALHAAVLGFIHPVTQDKLRLFAPPPPDMMALLRALGGDDADFTDLSKS